MQKKFAADQSIDAESMDKIIEIVKYLSPCESKRCREYDFEVKNSKPNGWTLVKSVLIDTTSNQCAYNKKYLIADSHSVVDSPTTRGLVLIKKMPKGPRPTEPFYAFPGSRISCPTSENRPAIVRSFIFSYKGIYVSDTPDGDPSEILKPATKRIGILGGGRPELIYQDANTLRFQWPNGAYVDLGDDGKFRDSNFLDPKSFTTNLCTGHVSKNGHVAQTPKIYLKSGQTWAR